MLNTKSIKKKLFNEVDFSDNNQQNAGNAKTENKTNDTMSSKEIIKLHNENLNNQRNNLKVMDEAIKQREINKFIDNFKGGNENISTIQENVQHNNNNNQNLQLNNNNQHLQLNNNQHLLQGGNNNLVKELVTQIKNELHAPIPEQPQIILIAPKTNLADNNNEYIPNRNLAEWDDNKNAYVIYNINNMIEGFFTNNDVVKSIINGSNINKNIKKYFFIIAHNAENNNNEFNFIDSIFTDNLDLIIKIQNDLFDLINQNDLFEKNDDDLDNLLIFNYQFIIYLFKKSNYFNNIESNKIAKFYSTLTFRFSSLILKQVMKIENQNISLANDISKLFDIKKDIISQLTNIENCLKNNTKIDIISSNTNTNSNTNKSIVNDIIDISTNDNSTDNNSQTDLYNTTIITGGLKKSNVLDEVISSITSNTNKQSSSKYNRYQEINDEVSSYMDKQISGNLKTSETSVINLNKNTYKITNKNTTTTIPSYNKSSAIKNGQIYKI
jgi:hypothetical protein